LPSGNTVRPSPPPRGGFDATAAPEPSAWRSPLYGIAEELLPVNFVIVQRTQIKRHDEKMLRFKTHIGLLGILRS
jgi:hypothetical protein